MPEMDAAFLVPLLVLLFIAVVLPLIYYADRFFKKKRVANSDK